MIAALRQPANVGWVCDLWWFVCREALRLFSLQEEVLFILLRAVFPLILH